MGGNESDLKRLWLLFRTKTQTKERQDTSKWTAGNRVLKTVAAQIHISRVMTLGRWASIRVLLFTQALGGTSQGDMGRRQHRCQEPQISQYFCSSAPLLFSNNGFVTSCRPQASWDTNTGYIQWNKEPTRCYLVFFITLMICSTCFGHLYAHHQELTIIYHCSPQ
jgi:hypothetical protein